MSCLGRRVEEHFRIYCLLNPTVSTTTFWWTKCQLTGGKDQRNYAIGQGSRQSFLKAGLIAVRGPQKSQALMKTQTTFLNLLLETLRIYRLPPHHLHLYATHQSRCCLTQSGTDADSTQFSASYLRSNTGSCDLTQKVRKELFHRQTAFSLESSTP